MSPTLDETATVRDARLAEHGKRQLFLRGLSSALFEGLPAPSEIIFGADLSVTLRMDSGAPADVDDWAAFLGTTASTDPHVFPPCGRGPWQQHETPRWTEWLGYQAYVWCDVPVEPVAS